MRNFAACMLAMGCLLPIAEKTALAAPQPSDCRTIFRKLPLELSAVAKASDDAQVVSRAARKLPSLPQKLVSHDPVSKWMKPIHSFRDYLTQRLQVWNSHPYPVLTLDDAPIAYWWASQAFVRPEEGQLETLGVGFEATGLRAPVFSVPVASRASAQPFKLDEIDKELTGFLDHVENYASDMQHLVDKMADNEIKIAALQDLLKTKLSAGGIQASLPAWTRDAQGNPSLGKDSAYFGTAAQIKIELRQRQKSRSQLARDLGGRVLDQAIMIQRIESYRGELERQMAKHESSLKSGQEELSRGGQNFLNRAQKLYADDKNRKLKPEYEPSTWAQQKLKNQHLRKEATAVIVTDARLIRNKFKDQEQLKKVIEWVEGLSDSDRRVLGINDISDVTGKWWENVRWLRLGSLALGATTILTGGGISVHNFLKSLIERVTAKGDCASKPTDEEFVACADEYLTNRFPASYLAKHGEKAPVFDEKGRIQDPAILGEIADLSQRRFAYQSGVNAQKTLEDAAKHLLGEKEIGSEIWRGETLRLPEPQFRDRILNSDPARGYLSFEFPQLVKDHPEILGLAGKIFSSVSPQEKERIKDELSQRFGAGTVADSVERLLNERSVFLAATPEQKRIPVGEEKGMLKP